MIINKRLTNPETVLDDSNNVVAFMMMTMFLFHTTLQRIRVAGFTLINRNHPSVLCCSVVVVRSDLFRVCTGDSADAP